MEKKKKKKKDSALKKQIGHLEGRVYTACRNGYMVVFSGLME